MASRRSNFCDLFAWPTAEARASCEGISTLDSGVFAKTFLAKLDEEVKKFKEGQLAAFALLPKASSSFPSRGRGSSSGRGKQKPGRGSARPSRGGGGPMFTGLRSRTSPTQSYARRGAGGRGRGAGGGARRGLLVASCGSTQGCSALPSVFFCSSKEALGMPTLPWSRG